MLPGRVADTGAVIEDEGDGGRADTGDFAMSRIVRSDIKHTNFQDTKPILANKSWNCKHKTGDYKLFCKAKSFMIPMRKKYKTNLS